jgi:hypothetical protein
VRSAVWNYLGCFFVFVSGLLLLAYVVRQIPVHDYGLYMAQAKAAFLYLLAFGMGNVLVPSFCALIRFSGRAQAKSNPPLLVTMY